MERIARSIATLQQQSKQFVGKLPFGVTTLVCGFDCMNSPDIYERLPNGAYTEWKGMTIRVHDPTVMEYLEKHSRSL
jgi:20S proteasome alpha/beta subunit